MRQRERSGLERLEAFVRETVLPRTYPHTMERRRVLEALGKADRLCNARTIEYSTGDVILCTRKASHYDPGGYDPLGETKSEGSHKCSTRTWIDDQPCNYPNTAA
ncbi:hypothetical protein [Streptomyces sp. NPDC048496]|uniref:hypothetical protein n=1 Tax=Streptomyces sp. NPDC048496 TaxID=3365558 RepID=UPI00371489EB